MVQCLASAFGGSNSYVQIVLDLDLPDEIVKPPWAQAGIKRYVLSSGFTRYNASYLNLTPFIAPSNSLDKRPLYLHRFYYISSSSVKIGLEIIKPTSPPLSPLWASPFRAEPLLQRRGGGVFKKRGFAPLKLPKYITSE